MERLLDMVRWIEREPNAERTGDLPYVTHEGVLHIIGYDLKVYRLSSGQTVFDGVDFERFIGVVEQPEQPA
jgi:hypothetical protein